MDKPIQMAIGVGLAIGAMAIVGVYAFGAIGGSASTSDIMPKNFDAISSNEGKTLQISGSLTNQGSGSITRVVGVLRVDVMDVCNEGSKTAAHKCTTDAGLGPGVIYFPIHYSGDIVEPFDTFNIRGMIESPGEKYTPTISMTHNPVGCAREADEAPAFIASEAGFGDIGNAISFANDKKPDVTHDDNHEGYKAEQNTVKQDDLLCARNLGVFAGEEVILTVIARTTSGDTIERIIPLRVR